MRLCVSVALVAACLISCGKASPSEPRNIFGPDLRETPPNAAPYTALGRLDVGCTGTLIGHRLVLTAAHCVIDNGTGVVKPTFTFFRPNFRGGSAPEALWPDYAWLGGLKPEDDRLQDWAILRLAEPPQGSYGRVAVQTVDFAGHLPYLTSLVGYSDDRSGGDDPSLHRGCYVMQVVDGKLYHACDGAAGVSGGPLLDQIGGNWSIVGITVSEYRQGAPDTVHQDQWTPAYANVGVPASRFVDTVNALLQTVDVGLAAPQLPGVIERPNPNQRPGNQTGPTNPGAPTSPGSPGTPPAGNYQPQVPQTALVPQSVYVGRAPALKQIMANMQAGAINLGVFAAAQPPDLGPLVGAVQAAVRDVAGDVDRFGSGKDPTKYADTVYGHYAALWATAAQLSGYTGFAFDPYRQARLVTLVQNLAVVQLEAALFQP